MDQANYENDKELHVLAVSKVELVPFIAIVFKHFDGDHLVVAPIYRGDACYGIEKPKDIQKNKKALIV